MPRAALRNWRLPAALAAGALWGLAAAALDPHVDPGIVTGGCVACHAGHGASRSPMLEEPQQAVCLRCLGWEGERSRQVLAGNLSAGSEATLLSSVLALPVRHPLSDDAFSARQREVVTCTSCHSPHRASAETHLGEAPPGRRKRSPKDPDRFEFELCQGCHGAAGAGAVSPLDISRLTSPSSRSSHPIEAPAAEASPSVRPALAGKEINCSDCHGNSERSGPRGPHGSAVPYLLRTAYATADGGEESAELYALCYGCHDRDAVLAGSPFPGHREHVVERNASCSACHNPHGSVRNRALIRFGEGDPIAGVGPSAATGRLAFISSGPGSGTCYLTCHGRDHAPAGYGLGEPELETVIAPQLGDPTLPQDLPPLLLPPTSRPRPERRPPPP